MPKALLQNTSTSVNAGHSLSSQVQTMYQVLKSCFMTPAGSINVSCFFVACCLTVIPLCALVIYISVQRWSQSSGMTASHTDSFTNHTVVYILLAFIGMTLIGCGIITALNPMLLVGLIIFCASMFGLMFFDTLICVERYVAVVHPITYRNLKNAKGVVMRNVAIGCVWLLSVLMSFLMLRSGVLIVIIFLCCTVVCITIAFFCSLCVLFVLIRPGPGKVGWAKPQVDQSKLKAFYTIVIILAMLLVRFVTNTVLSSFYTSAVPSEDTKCHLVMSIVWMSLPGGMVQPLLFLHRAGWLVCGKCNN